MSTCYAVKMGRKPGIYDSWQEVLEQTKDFNGASFKKCSSRKEALRVLGVKSEKDLKRLEMEQTLHLSKRLNISSIYIDGSYDHQYNVFAYALVVVEKGEIIYKESEAELSSKTAKNLHSASGELKAAMKAIQYAINNNKKNIIIYYDYEQIVKLLTGESKPRNSYLHRYIRFMNRTIKKHQLEVNFTKVKAHNGNEFNELADTLAKEKMRERREKEVRMRQVNNILYETSDIVLSDYRDFFIEYSEGRALPKHITKSFQDIAKGMNLICSPSQAERFLMKRCNYKKEKSVNKISSLAYSSIEQQYKVTFRLDYSHSERKEILGRVIDKANSENVLLSDQEIVGRFHNIYESTKKSVEKMIQQEISFNRKNKKRKKQLRQLCEEMIKNEPILYYNYSHSTALLLVRKFYEQAIQNKLYISEKDAAVICVKYVGDLMIKELSSNKVKQAKKNII